MQRALIDLGKRPCSDRWEFGESQTTSVFNPSCSIARAFREIVHVFFKKGAYFFENWFLPESVKEPSARLFLCFLGVSSNAHYSVL
jgi:hypothetical protein